MTKVSPCPNCAGTSLYKTRGSVGSGGGHAPNYLPGLGKFFRAGKFDLVLCRDCGLTRWFAGDDALERLDDSGKWERV